MPFRPSPATISLLLAFLLTTLLPLPAAAQQTPAPAAPAPIHAFSSDINDTTEAQTPGPAAITIVGTRNGVFSGKVVVTANGSIANLKASVTNLKQPDASIPASAIQIRFGAQWSDEFRGRNHPPGYDLLLETAPQSIPDGHTAVWLTVRIPKDAKPGKYTGQLTIEAAAGPALAVPVSLEVADWTLPDSQDYRTVIELIESPDTLAVEYNTPLWSGKHWDMIAKSLHLLRDTGDRVVHIPLICHTNEGNDETMIRWIKKGATYEPDFTIMDHYLDLFEKEVGKPKLVILYAWDVLLTTPPSKYIDPADNDGSYQKQEKARLRARAEQAAMGIPVTAWDPATNKSEMIHLPIYADPASKALWQPVWDGILQRMQTRGISKTNLLLGMASDWQPSAPEAKLLAELSGNLPWASCSHHLHGVSDTSLGTVAKIAPIGLAIRALDFDFNINPQQSHMYGWQKPALQLFCWQYPRYYFTSSPPATIRHDIEVNITGGQRGMGHIGADFWTAVRTRAGKRAGTVTDRYPEAYWHSLDLEGALIGPGPDGPVGTQRLEAFREGIQECQARIAIESALTNPAEKARLGDLAAKAQQVLDDRQRALWLAKGASEEDLKLTDFRQKFWDLYLKKWDKAKGNAWFISSNWQQRDAALFTTAGLVEQKLAAAK